jgi:hypothetical protein
LAGEENGLAEAVLLDGSDASVAEQRPGEDSASGASE